MTRSHIYRGTIRHRRFDARSHEFRHRLGLVYLDVDHVDHVLGGRLTRARPGFVRFRREDYLGNPALPLGRAVRELVEGRIGSAPRGRIYLLTQLRTLGACFNPVSFYFCMDENERVDAVVAEVTNTPWGERHAYVLSRQGDGEVLGGDLPKRMHVSPFMAMDQVYTWRVSTPGARLSVHIENRQRGQLVFDATLSLRREPLTQRSLRRLTFSYPLGTARVLALIYGHALALKLKGVPVHSRPEVAA